METARLRLEPWREEHASLLAQISASPAAMRFMGTGETWSTSKAREVSETQLDHWKKHGFGWQAAVEKASRRAIGLISFNFVGEGTVGLAADESEIGSWFDPSVWRRGLAREGGLAVRDNGFESIGAPSIVAAMQPDHDASIAGAEAIGLAFDFETTGRLGERLLVYRLFRDDWRELGSGGH